MPDLAKIEGEDLVIRVSIATIPLAVNAGWAAHKVETPVRVDDPKEFAKQMLYTLNAEQSGRSGNTLVMDIMDQAINGAIEFGAGEVITEEEAEALATSFQAPKPERQDPPTDRNGTLRMTFLANSGYESDETHRISPDQWQRILCIANEP